MNPFTYTPKNDEELSLQLKFFRELQAHIDEFRNAIIEECVRAVKVLTVNEPNNGDAWDSGWNAAIKFAAKDLYAMEKKK